MCFNNQKENNTMKLYITDKDISKCEYMCQDVSGTLQLRTKITIKIPCGILLKKLIIIMNSGDTIKICHIKDFNVDKYKCKVMGICATMNEPYLFELISEWKTIIE